MEYLEDTIKKTKTRREVIECIILKNRKKMARILG